MGVELGCHILHSNCPHAPRLKSDLARSLLALFHVPSLRLPGSFCKQSGVRDQGAVASSSRLQGFPCRPEDPKVGCLASMLMDGVQGCSLRRHPGMGLDSCTPPSPTVYPLPLCLLKTARFPSFPFCPSSNPVAASAAPKFRRCSPFPS